MFGVWQRPPQAECNRAVWRVAWQRPPQAECNRVVWRVAEASASRLLKPVDRASAPEAGRKICEHPTVRKF